MDASRSVTRHQPHLVTGTTHGDEAANESPKPKPGDGAFMEVISSPRNELEKRPGTLVAEGHPTMDTSCYSCTLAPNHANAKLLEAPSWNLKTKGQKPYVSVNETTRPPSLRLCVLLSFM